MKLYRGVVVDNNDPTRSGRVRVQIPSLHGPIEMIGPKNTKFTEEDKKNTEDKFSPEFKKDNAIWAEVMHGIDYTGFFNTDGYSGNYINKNVSKEGNQSKTPRNIKRTKGPKIGGFGNNIILEIGTKVFCLFEEDDDTFQNPIVIGTIASYNEINENSSPYCKRVYNSTSGNLEVWDDTPGKESIIIRHRTGSETEYAPNGNIEIESTKDISTVVSNNVSTNIGQNNDLKIQGNNTHNISGNEIININGTKTDTISSTYKISANGGTIVMSSGKIMLN